jgi:hypothetical protein
MSPTFPCTVTDLQLFSGVRAISTERMHTMTRRLTLALLIIVAFCSQAAAQSRGPKPEGEMRWALYVTLATSWFDPGEITGGFLTPFWVPLRDARRAREADARQPHGAEPGRVVDGERGPARRTTSSCARD